MKIIKNSYNQDIEKKIKKYNKLQNELLVLQKEIYKNKIPQKSLFDVIRYVLNIIDLTYEKLIIVYLKGENIIQIDEIKGVATSVFSSPQIFLRKMLNIGSHGIIIIHNHTTGDTTPSDTDLKSVEKIEKAMKVMDFILYDFLIIGDGIYSYVAKRTMPIEKYLKLVNQLED